MGNKARANFVVMSDEIQEIVGWLSVNVPQGGRVLFAGEASHAYGGGKVAALPVFTNREMMACDYYGFSPKLVEYNYPPREFIRSGPEKLMEFFDLYNVTTIVTYHEVWKRAFRKHPQQYTEEVSFGKKTIFSVNRLSDMFLQGKGALHAGINSIAINLEVPEESVVIKYNWVEGLSATPDGVLVEPYDTGTSVQLIKVLPNGARQITLSYDRWF